MNSPIAASISVPPLEQEEFNKNKARLLDVLKNCGKQTNFSKLIRKFVNTATFEERDGEEYLIVKL